MSLTIGIEVEFFGKRKGKYEVLSKHDAIPTDGYPLLAEARGKPSKCPYQAVGSVRGEVDRIVSIMRGENIRPVFVNWVSHEETKVQHEEILRRGISKRTAWRNLSGLSLSAKNETHHSAGMHVSFTRPVTIHQEDGDLETNGLFDYAHLFRALTLEFAAEMKEAERVHDFYEVKYDGRVEYRSLPATLIFQQSFAPRLARCIASST